jgi:hypothetical protein
VTPMASTPDPNHVSNALTLASELADVLEEVAAATNTTLDELLGILLPDDTPPEYPDLAGLSNYLPVAADNILTLADREVRRRRADRGDGKPLPDGYVHVPGDLTRQAAVAELRARARGRTEPDPFAGFPAH